MNDLISGAPIDGALRVRFGTKAITFAGMVVGPAGGAAPQGSVVVQLTDAAGRVWTEGGAEVGDRGRFVAELDTANLPASLSPYTVTYRYDGGPEFAASRRAGLLQVYEVDPKTPEEVVTRAKAEEDEIHPSASSPETTAEREAVSVVTSACPGDGESASGASPLRSQTVRPAAAVVTLRSSRRPAAYGQPVGFTAVVAAAKSGDRIPEGTVRFYDEATLLGTAALQKGKAALPPCANWSAGVHPITAVYSGDDDYLSAASGVVVQQIKRAATLLRVMEEDFASTQETIALRVSVLPRPPARGQVRGGTVTVAAGARVLGIAPVDPVRGHAVMKFDAVWLSDAAELIVHYSGAGDFLASSARHVLANHAEAC